AREGPCRVPRGRPVPCLGCVERDAGGGGYSPRQGRRGVFFVGGGAGAGPAAGTAAAARARGVGVGFSGGGGFLCVQLAGEGVEAREQLPGEFVVERRTRRLYEHEAAAAILRDVAVTSGIDRGGSGRALHLIAQELEQAEWILPNHLRDLG